MPQTTNLGLPLWGESPPEGATGLDLRNAIIGENDNSLAQKIDAQVERLENKAAEISEDADNDQYPTTLAVKKYVDDVIEWIEF